VTTINNEEVRKFSAIAHEWWDEAGKLKTLHTMNPLRISYIKNKILSHYKIQNQTSPFSGLKILDVGCGGGLLSEPMSRLGAEVTGIDASAENIKVAEMHSNEENLSINYLATSIEEFQKTSNEDEFDVILCLELVEHVDNPSELIKACATLLKKNGMIFIATINRTIKSHLLAITAAEYILRLVPVGTHNWSKFFKPSEIVKILRDCSIRAINIQGMQYNPLKRKVWTLSDDVDVNYIICGIKKSDSLDTA